MYRSSHWRGSMKKIHKVHRKTSVLESLLTLRLKKGALTQIFSCKFCEIFKKIFCTKHLWAASSECLEAVHQRCFVKAVFLEISRNAQENTSTRCRKKSVWPISSTCWQTWQHLPLHGKFSYSSLSGTFTLAKKSLKL